MEKRLKWQLFSSLIQLLKKYQQNYREMDLIKLQLFPGEGEPRGVMTKHCGSVKETEVIMGSSGFLKKYFIC